MSATFEVGHRVVVKADNDYDKGIPFDDVIRPFAGHWGHVVEFAEQSGNPVVRLEGHVANDSDRWAVLSGTWTFDPSELEHAD